jgi:hypothetical protein
MVGLEVAHPDADPAVHREREHPPESGTADRAHVAAEELDHRGITGWHDHEPCHDQEKDHDRQPEQRRLALPGDDRPCDAPEEHQHSEPPVECGGWPLRDVDPPASGPDCSGRDHGVRCVHRLLP